MLCCHVLSLSNDSFCLSFCAFAQVGHPFDLVKVRLQTEGASGRFRGPLQCVMATVRSEGVMSLYKGVTPPLLGTGVINALVFGLQGLFVGVAKGREGLGESDPATLSHTVQAAMATGAVISLVVTVRRMRGLWRSRTEVCLCSMVAPRGVQLHLTIVCILCVLFCLCLCASPAD
jgi:hypothetical protein